MLLVIKQFNCASICLVVVIIIIITIIIIISIFKTDGMRKAFASKQYKRK